MAIISLFDNDEGFDDVRGVFDGVITALSIIVHLVSYSWAFF